MTDRQFGAGQEEERSPLARFDVVDQDRIRTVRASGEIDVSNVTELQGTMADLPNAALGVVLVLNETDYIDSATIRLLYDLRRRLARRGQILSLVSSPGSNVQRVLELATFLPAGDPHPASATEAAAGIRDRLTVGDPS